MKKYFVKQDDQFSFLTAIERHDKRQWKFRCICGVIVIRRSDEVARNAHKKIQSCGCKHPLNTANGTKHPQFKGYEEISNEFWFGITRHAKNRHIPLNITIQDAWNQFIKQDKKCALTNLELKFATRSQKRHGLEHTASLDRIDNTLGYEINNIQWIHKDVNLMKSDMSQQEFIDLCKQIVKYNNL